MCQYIETEDLPGTVYIIVLVNSFCITTDINISYVKSKAHSESTTVKNSAKTSNLKLNKLLFGW
jgi:hypothetical protein